MSSLYRVRVTWNGSAVVGGGVSTFYFDTPATGYSAALVSFFTSLRPSFGASVVWEVPQTGDILESTTGDITGSWTDGTTTQITGQQTAPVYAAGVGCRILWNTLGRTNNRRVRGSTFLVPLAADRYDTLGTLDPGVVSVFKTAGDTLIAHDPGSLVIWTRPNASHAGSVNSVTSADVPDKVSWLRSRRV